MLRVCWVVCCLLFVACSPTKYLTGDQRVVDKNIIIVDNKEIKTNKLKKNAQPQELKKVFGIVPLRAMIYNLYNPNKKESRQQYKNQRIKAYNDKQDEKFNKKLGQLQKRRNRMYNKSLRLQNENKTKAYQRTLKKYNKLNERLIYLNRNASDIKSEKYKTDIKTIADIVQSWGQEPQLCDTFKIKHTCQQFTNYMNNLGYLKAQVTYKIDTLRRKRVQIKYIIKSNEPLKIGQVIYDTVVYSDYNNIIKNFKQKIQTGTKINFEELENYRTHFGEYARQNGYYYFSKQFITYRLDTNNNRYSNAILYVDLNKNVDINKVYKPWYINKVYIFSDYDPNLAMTNPTYLDNLDTLIVQNEYCQNVYLIKKNQYIIKPKHLIREIYIYSDSVYSLNSTRSTYSHLSKFKIFKLVNIQFNELDSTAEVDKNLLDCNIMLTPQELTDFKIETYASRNNISAGLNVDWTLSHRNLFKGGEILEFSNQISIENQQLNNDVGQQTKFFNAQEYAASMRLILPRLWAPVQSTQFIRRNNPTTILDFSISYQNRPEYTRLQTMFRYDYSLKSSNLSSHSINVWRLSLIKANLTDEFRQWVEKVNLSESYTNHMILSSGYNYTFSNQGKNKPQIYYINTNFILAGNWLYAIMKLTKQDTVNYYYKTPIIDEPFAQFAKIDLEFRYSHKQNNEQYAYRLFVGLGFPYGNSRLLPFSEKYFVGGPNSIRAWTPRSLGPGDYVQPNIYRYINQTADIRLETNFEYRFKIISVLEGATFVDIGNIWNINSYDSRAGGVFYLNKFYKELAIGTGFGLRVNVNFFVLRLDIGLKVFDPSLPEGKRFIPDSRKYTLKDINPNFAFGYPF